MTPPPLTRLDPRRHSRVQWHAVHGHTPPWTLHGSCDMLVRMMSLSQTRLILPSGCSRCSSRILVDTHGYTHTRTPHTPHTTHVNRGPTNNTNTHTHTLTLLWQSPVRHQVFALLPVLLFHPAFPGRVLAVLRAVTFAWFSCGAMLLESLGL
jgi:hypothetical protein